ncbi:MAG: ABC transporter permease, partial [Streptosporangiaceae bacterium]
MMLVALTALLVGGIGVFGGVSSWTEARLPTLATLRALGASQGLLATTLMLQILILAAGGIACGTSFGIALTPLVAALFGADLPVAVNFVVHPVPLMLAAAFGLVTAILCMLWPVMRASRLSAAALFRQPLPGASQPVPAATFPALAVLLLCLIALAVLATRSPGFVLGYAAAAALSLAVLAGAGRLLMRLAAHLGRRARLAWLRLGLADLHRPGAPTVLTIVSIGLGLSTLGAVVLIEGNLNTELLKEMPKSAPSFYFIDIQDDELAQFRALLGALPGVEAHSEVPMLRARIVAVNGVPAAHLPVNKDARWALRKDLGLTYAARPPPGTELTAGHWWPPDYSGPALVSLDARLAADLGV